MFFSRKKALKSWQIPKIYEQLFSVIIISITEKLYPDVDEHWEIKLYEIE